MTNLISITKYLILTAFYLSVKFTVCQPILTQTNSAYIPGDVYMAYEFPTATVAQEISGEYNYMLSTTSGFVSLGQVSSSNTLIYNTPLALFCYPFTSNTTCYHTEFSVTYLSDSIHGVNEMLVLIIKSN